MNITPETYDTESHGKRNLIILGASALIITFATTCLSLWIYRTSGDIYLDRSRPGFLPDEKEADEELPVNNNFVFSDTGELTESDLGDYLKELKTLETRIDAIAKPYSPDPLSDESLGIPSSDGKTDKTTNQTTTSAKK